MPTVNELLKRLPEPIAEMVKENVDDNRDFMDCQHLIMCGFVWRDSPEKYKFWNAVYEYCIANKI